jgi:hypothetical protein
MTPTIRKIFRIIGLRGIFAQIIEHIWLTAKVFHSGDLAGAKGLVIWCQSIPSPQRVGGEKSKRQKIPRPHGTHYAETAE